jgi:hypothetical protein
MHPFHHAQNNPDRAAYIMAGTGERSGRTRARIFSAPLA